MLYKGAKVPLNTRIQEILDPRRHRRDRGASLRKKKQRGHMHSEAQKCSLKNEKRVPPGVPTKSEFLMLWWDSCSPITGEPHRKTPTCSP